MVVVRLPRVECVREFPFDRDKCERGCHASPEGKVICAICNDKGGCCERDLKDDTYY